MENKKVIKNKKASFHFYLLEKYIAGIQLMGTEIKSIREGKASLAEAYCYMSKQNELYVKNMHIAEYKWGGSYNHEPKRERKLLLTKKELKKLGKRVRERGLTIVPTLLYIDERGLAKLEIALAKGKHTYDKREDIKQKDMDKKMKQVRSNKL